MRNEMYRNISNLLNEIVKNVEKGQSEFNLDDLKQDIMLSLLEKGDKKIEEMVEKNQIPYYLTRMVLNNLYSKTSRYYYKYILPQRRYAELKQDIITNDKED